jgi:hypothetical protein
VTLFLRDQGFGRTIDVRWREIPKKLVPEHYRALKRIIGKRETVVVKSEVTFHFDLNYFSLLINQIMIVVYNTDTAEIHKN